MIFEPQLQHVWDKLSKRPGVVVRYDDFYCLASSAKTYVCRIRKELENRNPGVYAIENVRNVGFVLRKFGEPAVVEKPKHSSIIQSYPCEDIPSIAPRQDLPEPSRKTLALPCPVLRPRYARPIHRLPYRFVEKTKTQLREELRQAVENTR